MDIEYIVIQLNKKGVARIKYDIYEPCKLNMMLNIWRKGPFYYDKESHDVNEF